MWRVRASLWMSIEFLRLFIFLIMNDDNYIEIAPLANSISGSTVVEFSREPYSHCR